MTNVGVDGVAGVVVVGAVVLGVDVLGAVSVSGASVAGVVVAGAVSISAAASGLAGAPVDGDADSTSVVTRETVEDGVGLATVSG